MQSDNKWFGTLIVRLNVSDREAPDAQWRLAQVERARRIVSELGLPAEEVLGDAKAYADALLADLPLRSTPPVRSLGQQLWTVGIAFGAGATLAALVEGRLDGWKSPTSLALALFFSTLLAASQLLVITALAAMPLREDLSVIRRGPWLAGAMALLSLTFVTVLRIPRDIQLPLPLFVTGLLGLVLAGAFAVPFTLRGRRDTDTPAAPQRPADLSYLSIVHRELVSRHGWSSKAATQAAVEARSRLTSLVTRSPSHDQRADDQASAMLAEAREQFGDPVRYAADIARQAPSQSRGFNGAETALLLSALVGAVASGLGLLRDGRIAMTPVFLVVNAILVLAGVRYTRLRRLGLKRDV